ncbi:MAG: DMT family transporter [Myxococcales bacterium]|nr:DMT family transporter [Myxococcales bacterium]
MRQAPSPTRQPPTRRTALVAVLFVQIAFAIWPVVGSIVLRHMTPRALVGLRVALAGPLLFVLTRPWRARMPWRDVLRCAGLAVIGVGLNQVMFIEGLSRSTPTNSAILGCLTPALTAGIAVGLGHEKMAARRWAGLGLALAGALFLVGVERLQFGGERGIGNLLFMANTVAYSSYLVLARPLIARHGALPVTGWTFAAATPMLALYGAPALQQTAWAAIPAEAWYGIAYIVVVATVLAYIGVAWALAALPASIVAIFVYLQPLVTGLAANRILGERPAWTAWVAAAAILGGIGLVAGRPGRATSTVRA